MGKVLNRIKNVFCTILLLILAAGVVFTFYQRISGATPQIFGYGVYRISSGSMVPDLQIGDIIVCSQTDAQNIHNGDIITYKGTTGDVAGKIITHKVVEEPYQTDNQWHFQTCGIAPGAVKDPSIIYEQILGKYSFTVPFAGAIYNVFITPWGLLIFIGILCVMFSTEVVNLIRIIKSVPKKDTDNDSQENSRTKFDDGDSINDDNHK